MRINDANKFICVIYTQFKNVIAVTNITRTRYRFGQIDSYGRTISSNRFTSSSVSWISPPFL